LRRAHELRPQEVTARLGLAGALLSQGNLDESRDLLEGVIAEVPDYTEAHVLLATCYYRLKRTADGDKHKAIAERLRQKEQERQPKGTGGQ
jgi:Tfp pilus assembly protein PilF